VCAMGTKALAVLASAGLLALGTACSGDSPDPGRPSGTGPSAGSTSSSVPAAGPDYGGPALPGLSARPLWSAQHQVKGIDPRMVELGDTLVLARADDAPTPSATASASAGSGPQWRSAPAILDFRDVATGRVKTSVRTPLDSVRRDTWGGKPVVVVTYQGVTASDGLSVEKPLQVLAGYDAGGAKVGQYEAEGDERQFAVVGGRVIHPTGAGVTDQVAIKPLNGGPGAAIRCALPVCGYSLHIRSGATVGTPGINVPALVGDLAFTLERAGSASPAMRLVAVDAVTGQRRWTSGSIQPPAGARAEGDIVGLRVTPVAMVGSKLLLSWSAAGEVGPRIAALHDPATGRLLATGPTLPADVNTVLTDPGGKIAVVAATASAAETGSAAWDLETGKVLWTQAADEKPLSAVAVVNSVLYGHTVREGAISSGLNDEFIVVDLRTKKVLQPALVLPSAPTATATGHGIVLRGDAVYVFGPSS
jgi:PQQ-like domain